MPRDLRGILDALLAGVVVVDTDGRVELVNEVACRMLDTSAETLAGQPVESIQGPSHSIATLARRVIGTARSAAENELSVERAPGDALVIDLAVSPLFDDENGGDNTPSGAVLVLRDRTIQRDLAQKAYERERLTAFGQIAAGIAHEVKNPLGGIRGAAEIVGMRSSDEKTRDAASLVVREVDRITDLVDDMMVFTRGQDLRFTAVNIHRILDRVLDLIEHDPVAQGVVISREYDPSIPVLSADADRLTQVFLNLVRNAAQSMEKSDAPRNLTVRTRVTLDHRLSDDGGRPISTLLVSLTDTGVGIEADVLEQLATPFFTTRPGGTGLGLAISRQWVSRHGGTLRIESKPGAGTTVSVLLPLRPPEGPETPQ